MSFSDLTIEDYNGRCVVMYGNTRKYKEDLKKMGGKYNGRLNNGPGWVFPKTCEGELASFIKKGERLVSAEEEKSGEERTKLRAKEWEQQQNSEKKVSSRVVRPESNVIPTLSEYGAMIILMKEMSEKIVRIDKALTLILTDDQKVELNKLNNPKPRKIVSEEVDDEDKIPKKRLMRK
jgi:hypothetical protein